MMNFTVRSLTLPTYDFPYRGMLSYFTSLGTNDDKIVYTTTFSRNKFFYLTTGSLDPLDPQNRSWEPLVNPLNVPVK